MFSALMQKLAGHANTEKPNRTGKFMDYKAMY